MPDRYNLPIQEFLETILQEAYPDRQVGEGSVWRDQFIDPLSLILQPLRDYQRVTDRNMSLRNFQVMLPEEMDRLAANFLVSRQSGAFSTGEQRVVFNAPQDVSIGAGARFTDSAGRVFVPQSPVNFTEEQVRSRVITTTGQYFVDVPTIAQVAGEDYSVAAGAVTTVSGVPGAISTINNTAYSGGRADDSNTDLYRRIRTSVTNKDLVSARAIESEILANFGGVKQVNVVGFGDDLMTRDVVRAVIDTEELFNISFARKVNLPLDENGDVKFYDDDNNIILTPVGGYAGAVVDLTGMDFYAIPVTLGTQNVRYVAAQPGYRFRGLLSSSSLVDVGDYTITRVLDTPIEPGGEDFRVLLLDRPFSDSDVTFDAAADSERWPYTIVGDVATNSFHVGGKVDVYINSTNNEEKSVIISSLITDTNGTAEVGVVEGDSPLYENNIGFDLPFLAITKMEELDVASEAVVLRTLTPGINYKIVRSESRGRFVQTANDSIIITGKDANGLPAFQGSRLKITYITNPDISAVEGYLADPVRRDITKDVRVLGPNIAFLDIDMTYSGPAATEVATLISDYLSNKGLGATVTVNEIVNVLTFTEVTDIQYPVTLTVRQDLGNGVVDTQVSTDRVTVPGNTVLVAADSLSLTLQ